MIPELYNRYFVLKHDERHGLFELVANRFTARSGIYPGSFVHITPAFYIPEMAFIDNDRRMGAFFRNEHTMRYIEAHAVYDEEPNVCFMQADYTAIDGIREDHYDLMFSFYAGFISQHCKRYLRTGGTLIANNSHGDASLAIADPDYELTGVVLRNGESFRLKTDTFSEYATKKDGSDIDVQKVRSRMVGEGFLKSGYAYIFKRIS